MFNVLSHFFTGMDCVWYETDVVANKSVNKHDKSILESTKQAPIREHLNDSSKLRPLKFNQPAVGPMAHRKPAKPFNESASHHQVKTKRNVLKCTHSFQPCNTCRQIVQQRKSISILSYRSMPFPAPVTPQLNIQPTKHNVSRMPITKKANGTCASKSKVKTAQLLNPEKSTLLQSKERIEGVLKMKRQQLQFLVSLSSMHGIPLDVHIHTDE